MSVKIEHQFNVSAEQLWAIVGTPDRIDWVPGATGCKIHGDIRSLTLAGAGNIKERILSHDNQRRILEYSCFETSAPLQSHRSRIEVVANADGCQLIWQTTVTPLAIEVFISKSMTDCVTKLEEILIQATPP